MKTITKQMKITFMSLKRAGDLAFLERKCLDWIRDHGDIMDETL